MTWTPAELRNRVCAIRDWAMERKAAVLGRRRLYRWVSPEEHQDLASTGCFAGGPNSVEGKYFAASHADARAWGATIAAAFRTPGAGHVVAIEVVRECLNRDFTYLGRNLDNIGPAWFASCSVANSPYVRLDSRRNCHES